MKFYYYLSNLLNSVAKNIFGFYSYFLHINKHCNLSTNLSIKYVRVLLWLIIASLVISFICFNTHPLENSFIIVLTSVFLFIQFLISLVNRILFLHNFNKEVIPVEKKLKMFHFIITIYIYCSILFFIVLVLGSGFSIFYYIKDILGIFQALETKNADQSALLEKYKSFIVRSKNLVDEARIIIDSKKSEEENLFAIFFGNSRLGGAELFILSMTWRVAQTILNIAHYGYPKD